MWIRVRFCIWLAIAALLGLVGGSICQAQDATVEIEAEAVDVGPALDLVGGGVQKVVPLSDHADHWIGVQCESVDRALKTHLGLESGVIVKVVVSDSPAETAGIKPLDILLKAGDVSIDDAANLVEIVNETGVEPIDFRLVREGQELTVKVKPAKREMYLGLLKHGQPVIKGGELTLGGILNTTDGDAAPLSIYFAKPGIVVGDDKYDIIHKLPQGLRLTIVKEADRPARIAVKKDEKEWNVDENELEQLPEDLRARIKAFLGQRKGQSTKPARVRWLELGRQETESEPKATGEAVLRWELIKEKKKDSDDDDRLAKIQKQLAQIQKQIEALRAEREKE